MSGSNGQPLTADQVNQALQAAGQPQLKAMASPQTPAVTGNYSVPSATSTLGNGQTFNPTNALQSGINSAYQNNSANGIAASPSNFARWQNYPASPSINKTVPALGTNGLATGGVQLGFGSAPGTTQIGGGGGGTGAPGSGGGVFGGNPGPIPGNPGNGNPGFTPNSGVLPDPNITMPGGQTTPGGVSRTFDQFRLPSTLGVQGIGQNVVDTFNQLMSQGKKDTAYSYLLAQPQGGNLLQAAWQPQWNDASTGADLLHQIIETHTRGNYDPQGRYDPMAQYIGIDPSVLANDPQYTGQVRLNAARAAKSAAKGGGNG